MLTCPSLSTRFITFKLRLVPKARGNIRKVTLHPKIRHEVPYSYWTCFAHRSYFCGGLRGTGNDRVLVHEEDAVTIVTTPEYSSSSCQSRGGKRTIGCRCVVSWIQWIRWSTPKTVGPFYLAYMQGGIKYPTHGEMVTDSLAQEIPHIDVNVSDVDIILYTRVSVL